MEHGRHRVTRKIIRELAIELGYQTILIMTGIFVFFIAAIMLL